MLKVGELPDSAAGIYLEVLGFSSLVNEPIVRWYRPVRNRIIDIREHCSASHAALAVADTELSRNRSDRS